MLQPVFEKVVEKSNIIYTDTVSCSSFPEGIGYHHETSNHSQKEYVRVDVHENRSENLRTFWTFWNIFILPFRGIARCNLTTQSVCLRQSASVSAKSPPSVCLWESYSWLSLMVYQIQRHLSLLLSIFQKMILFQCLKFADCQLLKIVNYSNMREYYLDKVKLQISL